MYKKINTLNEETFYNSVLSQLDNALSSFLSQNARYSNWITCEICNYDPDRLPISISELRTQNSEIYST